MDVFIDPLVSISVTGFLEGEIDSPIQEHTLSSHNGLVETNNK
jgi:hypothetical protein